MHVIKYIGKTGFIKPIQALRDEEIVSQQYLHRSTIAGIERKLFPELLQQDYKQDRIIRHRISFSQMAKVMEQVQTRLPNQVKGKRGWYKKDTVICNRHTMVNPVLYLAFSQKEYADKAYQETICLCRNEDLMYPVSLQEMTEEEFNQLEGCEMLYPSLADKDNLVPAGFNRYNREYEYGEIKFFGPTTTQLCF